MTVGRSIHHDLQQPLVTMIGFAQILRTGWESMDVDERDRLLDTIEREGMRLSEMLAGIAVLHEMPATEVNGS